MFKQVGTYTDKFTKQLTFLGKTFNSIGRDFKAGIGIRSLTSIVTQKDVTALNNFAKAIQNGANYTEAFKEHISKTPLKVRQQANEIIKLHTQQKQLNQQYNAGKITQQEYNTAMAANKTQMQAMTTQTQSLTLAQRAAAFTSKALGIALNIALNVGLMLAINAIISGISKLVNKQDELIESAKQSAQETSEYIDSLSGLKDKYLEIVDSENSVSEKTKELNQFKQELIETYGFEKSIGE